MTGCKNIIAAAKAGDHEVNVPGWGVTFRTEEAVLKFRYSDQQEGTQHIWWRFAKDRRPAALPERLGVASEDILLLYR